ncbi:hypothetical protein DERA104750_13905 [Deinococcus radiodurans]
MLPTRQQPRRVRKGGGQHPLPQRSAREHVTQLQHQPLGPDRQLHQHPRPLAVEPGEDRATRQIRRQRRRRPRWQGQGAAPGTNEQARHRQLTRAIHQCAQRLPGAGADEGGTLLAQEVGEEQLAVGAKREVERHPLALDGAQALAGVEVPQLRVAVAVAHRQPGAIGAEGEGARAAQPGGFQEKAVHRVGGGQQAEPPFARRRLGLNRHRQPAPVGADGRGHVQQHFRGQAHRAAQLAAGSVVELHSVPAHPAHRQKRPLGVPRRSGERVRGHAQHFQPLRADGNQVERRQRGQQRRGQARWRRGRCRQRIDRQRRHRAGRRQGADGGRTLGRSTRPARAAGQERQHPERQARQAKRRGGGRRTGGPLTRRLTQRLGNWHTLTKYALERAGASAPPAL